jgi:protein-L-isoaspartate O-methyltransferase
VLEVGAGTGYTAALLAHLVGSQGQVTTIDVDPEVVADARRNLAAGFDTVEVVLDDGALGHPNRAPYDRITAAVGRLRHPRRMAVTSGAGRPVGGAAADHGERVPLDRVRARRERPLAQRG